MAARAAAAGAGLSAAPATPDIPHVIRQAVPEDARFILETTAKVRQPRGVPWTQWSPVGLRNAQTALAQGRAVVADADGVILGFALAMPSAMTPPELALEMVYVKADFRGFGLGLEMLRGVGMAPGFLVAARAPTPCWRRWCAHHALMWRTA